MNKQDLITLKQLPGVGDTVINKILKLEPENIRDFCVSHKKYDLRIRQKDKFENALQNIDYYEEKALSIINDCEKKNIKIVTVKDNNYPELLKRIGSGPPTILYYKTKSPKNLIWPYNKNIAIVGTRNCTEEGRSWAYHAANKLTDEGFNIISGLASGIDTAAHKGSINSGYGKGITTAIVTNVDKISPKSNINLSEQIINNDGVLISENPPDVTFQLSQLISRNKIQTGVSQFVIVVECPEKGGTISTINYAKNQRRKIFIPDWDNMETPERYTLRKLLAENSAIPIKSHEINQLNEIAKKSNNTLF
jgi:DNA processing protein